MAFCLDAAASAAGSRNIPTARETSLDGACCSSALGVSDGDGLCLDWFLQCSFRGDPSMS